MVAPAAAASAIDYAALMVSDPNTMANTLGYNPYDNPTYFQNILVHQEENEKQQAHSGPDRTYDPDSLANGTTGWRSGLQDEGGKLNLNALMQQD